MRSFYTDTVTRLRAPLVDDGYNNQTRDWSAAVTGSISGCRWQPVSTEEVAENRNGVEVIARLLGPVDVDIAPDDRIEYGGKPYSVEGEPLRHRSPTGVAAHSETLLRRFDG